MILEHRGVAPTIDSSARIAPTAVVCGDVTIEAGCSIGFGTVLTAESGSIVVGRNVVIMDTAVVRGVRDHPVRIGENVLIGPRAYLSGCLVAADAFLATGATVFNGAEIGAGAEVRINGVVHLKTRLPARTSVPIGWIAVGDPAAILPPGAHDEIWARQEPLNFPKVVFGVDRPADGRSIMPHVMPRYAAALAKWHESDRPRG